MKWFKRMVVQWVRDDWENEGRIGAIPATKSRNEITLDRSSGLGDSRHRLNLTVYRANGGTIVETNRYDRRKDEHNCELHIVAPDTDLGEALSKIITYEGLKS